MIWTIKEKNWLRKNYPHKGAKYCSQKLNRPLTSIQRMCSRLKLKVTDARKSEVQSTSATQGWNDKRYSTLNVDHHFFEKQSYESLYLLGFLWADGYLYRKQNRISLEIVERDMVEIENLFCGSGKWHSWTRKRKKRKPQKGFCCNNKKLFQFLEGKNYDKKSVCSPD